MSTTTLGKASFENKHTYNQMFRYTFICHTVLCNNYKELKHFPLKRLTEVLNFIKIKNIPVEFNVMTIVNFLGRMFSHQLSDAQ